MMFDDFSIKEPYRISGVDSVRTGRRFNPREGREKKKKKKGEKDEKGPPGGGGRISIKI